MLAAGRGLEGVELERDDDVLEGPEGLEGVELEGDRQDDDGLEAGVVEVGLGPSLQEAQRPR